MCSVTKSKNKIWKRVVIRLLTELYALKHKNWKLRHSRGYKIYLHWYWWVCREIDSWFTKRAVTKAFYHCVKPQFDVLALHSVFLQLQSCTLYPWQKAPCQTQHGGHPIFQEKQMLACEYRDLIRLIKQASLWHKSMLPIIPFNYIWQQQNRILKIWSTAQLQFHKMARQAPSKTGILKNRDPLR